MIFRPPRRRGDRLLRILNGREKNVFQPIADRPGQAGPGFPERMVVLEGGDRGAFRLAFLQGPVEGQRVALDLVRFVVPSADKQDVLAGQGRGDSEEIEIRVQGRRAFVRPFPRNGALGEPHRAGRGGHGRVCLIDDFPHLGIPCVFPEEFPVIRAGDGENDAHLRAAGGIDLQLLGIGSDGHLGFNEPSSSLSSRTRIKTLTDRTRKDNAAAFGGEDNVPHHVITMGLGTIMDARTCLLLAFGRKKAAAIAQAVEGPVSAMVPASILQMHPRAIVILDEEAASGLKRTEYYRWVYDHKPSWQKD